MTSLTWQSIDEANTAINKPQKKLINDEFVCWMLLKRTIFVWKYQHQLSEIMTGLVITGGLQTSAESCEGTNVTPLANHADHHPKVPNVTIAWSQRDAMAMSTPGDVWPSMKSTLWPPNGLIFWRHHGISSLITMKWTSGRQSVKYAIDFFRYSDCCGKSGGPTRRTISCRLTCIITRTKPSFRNDEALKTSNVFRASFITSDENVKS